MAGPDREPQSLAKLRSAVQELAGEDATEVIAAARAEARARVQSLLAEEFAQALLDRVREQIAPAEPRPEPARTAVPPSQPQPEEQLAGDPGRAWYVYGVIGADQLDDNMPDGVDPGHPVSTTREGPLAAVVSRVATEDFGEAQLRAHLADMEWVELVARAHERVLDELRRRTTVIPMRMCTVYRSEDSVHEMLRSEADAFEEALAHLQGRTEWGVKVFFNPAGTTAQTPTTGAGDQDPERAGAAYFERRRQERDEQEQAAQLVQRAANEIHQALSALAADGLIAPPQRPEATGRRGEMLLNGVYLVADDALPEFEARVRELQDEFASAGLELELTGPWPAYNFVPGTIGAAW